MDVVDRQMLQILQREGRISNAALAEQLHLSPSPVPAPAARARASTA